MVQELELCEKISSAGEKTSRQQDKFCDPSIVKTMNRSWIFVFPPCVEDRSELTSAAVTREPLQKMMLLPCGLVLVLNTSHM